MNPQPSPSNRGGTSFSAPLEPALARSEPPKSRYRTLGARLATLAAVRILGVDLGSKRIGLSVSDEGGEIAFPAGIIESRGRKRDIAALKQLITEKEIGRAVVGLPLHMDGRHGPEADKATRFAAALSQAAGIPVELLDERWTSMEAERILADVPGKGRNEKRAQRRAKGTVDEMAASIILKTYLEQRAHLAAQARVAQQTQDE
jgi:putative Holliday junction resolvase